MGADWSKYEEYQKKIDELEAEKEDIYKNIEKLYDRPEMTDKKKRLARKFVEDNISTLSLIFPRFILSYKMKYWSIKKLFIDPRNKYLDRVSDINKLISDLENLQMIAIKEFSKEEIDNYNKLMNTRTVVVIDYDVNPGDCGDCY